jgi:hypothetical protein
MATQDDRATATSDEDRALEAIGHPRGTLAIVVAYAVLFVLGWLALYFFRFLGHGAPHSH